MRLAAEIELAGASVAYQNSAESASNRICNVKPVELASLSRVVPPFTEGAADGGGGGATYPGVLTSPAKAELKSTSPRAIAPNIDFTFFIVCLLNCLLRVGNIQLGAI